MTGTLYMWLFVTMVVLVIIYLLVRSRCCRRESGFVAPITSNALAVIHSTPRNIPNDAQPQSIWTTQSGVAPGAVGTQPGGGQIFYYNDPPPMYNSIGFAKPN